MEISLTDKYLRKTWICYEKFIYILFSNEDGFQCLFFVKFVKDRVKTR